MVGDADVIGDALAVLVVGEVGDAADVEADLVVAEKQLVADGHQRCALSALANIFATKVVNDREATCFDQLLSIADLQGIMLLGAVEDSVPVRGYEIGCGIMSLGEIQHLLAYVFAILLVQLHQVFRLLVEGLGEQRFPLFRIG